MLNEDLPIYEYQNTDLTVNDQMWIGGIAGLHNLERRQAEDMPTSDRLLFRMLQFARRIATSMVSAQPLLQRAAHDGPSLPWHLRILSPGVGRSQTRNNSIV